MAELISPAMFSTPHFGRLQSGSKRASSQMISGGPSWLICANNTSDCLTIVASTTARLSDACGSNTSNCAKGSSRVSMERPASTTTLISCTLTPMSVSGVAEGLCKISCRSPAKVAFSPLCWLAFVVVWFCTIWAAKVEGGGASPFAWTPLVRELFTEGPSVFALLSVLGWRAMFRTSSVHSS
jgi:hypothetical protein